MSVPVHAAAVAAVRWCAACWASQWRTAMNAAGPFWSALRVHAAIMPKREAFSLGGGDSNYINGPEPRWSARVDPRASFLDRQRAQSDFTPHAQLLSKRIRDLGSDPFDYKPLPAQIAMFNAMEGLNETCERVAGLSLAGETVANYLIQMCLKSPEVPEWIKQPYRKITEDEEGHGSVPQEFLKRYATTDDRQDRARRAVAMRMAAPSPSAKVSRSKLHGVIAFRIVKAPSSAATQSIQPCVTRSRRRRSTTSATAPAGSPTRNTGKVVAACTSATMAGLGAKEVISQAAPTFCIQVPIFDATAATQRARKNGWCSGAQVDACEGGSMFAAFCRISATRPLFFDPNCRALRVAAINFATGSWFFAR